MSIEIISTGNEIMSGLTLDTNFNWVARVLSERGISVNYHSTIRDNLDDLISAFNLASERSKIVIVTGGLGPTEDDLSSLAASKLLSTNLYFDQNVYDSIVKKLANRKRKPNEHHKKQARFPTGSDILENHIGTAAGFKIKYKNTTYYFLPGVPREFKQMFTQTVLKELESNLEKGDRVVLKILKTIGLGESEVAEKLKGLSNDLLKIGYRLRFPEVHVRISARIKNKDDEKILDDLLIKVHDILGDNLFAKDDETLEEVTSKILTNKKITLSTAESCTGGLVANRLTDIPGSSNYFLRGVVTYTNESKVEMLGVSKVDIDKHGAVSTEVVEQMADGVRKLANSDIGIGISGIAGPDGGTQDKPVGTVYIGFSYKDGTTFSNKYNFYGTRTEIKLATSSTAIDIVRKFCLHNV
ncbi:MAG: competence/damage-inducible protein A [Candidatus Dadabacteria bacterium]|nr:competence/damage-inducible protein A [Candidatus Dadabacteria bacterium]NIQ14232.1 competence/damage-inducible protein A [Candidatus Dadabacteria bacterium]